MMSPNDRRLGVELYKEYSADLVEAATELLRAYRRYRVARRHATARYVAKKLEVPESSMRYVLSKTKTNRVQPHVRVFVDNRRKNRVNHSS